MKRVKWLDPNGYLRAALVKNDEDATAGIYGIKVEPPNLDELDWESCKRDLHNMLVEYEIFTWQDLQMRQREFEMALGIVRRRLVSLYRERFEGGNNEQ